MRPLLLALILVLAACAGEATSAPTDTAAAVTTVAAPTTTAVVPSYEVVRERGLEFAPGVRGEVYRPVDDAGGWPVVVLVPGGSWRSADVGSTAPLAASIAARGAVVLNAPYRLTAPQAFADVACAVAFAAESAAVYGGDPRRLALAGHSAGAHITAVVAFGGDRAGATCPDRPAVPLTAWIGIAGAYDIALFEFLPGPQRFFGGTQETAPDAWTAGNPYTYLDDLPPLDIALVHGRTDIVVPPFSTLDLTEALAATGRPVTPVLISGANHFDVIDPARDGGRVAAVILDAVR